MSVTLLEVMGAARARRASLVGESAGYLVLAIADQVACAPRNVGATDIELSSEGALRILRGEAVAERVAEQQCRTLLGDLMQVSTHGGAALMRAAGRPGGTGLAAFVRELEAALVPANRAAARRSLARLCRETERALEAGAFEVPRIPVPPAAAAPPPVAAPAVARPEPLDASAALPIEVEFDPEWEATGALGEASPESPATTHEPLAASWASPSMPVTTVISCSAVPAGVSESEEPDAVTVQLPAKPTVMFHRQPVIVFDDPRASSADSESEVHGSASDEGTETAAECPDMDAEIEVVCTAAPDSDASADEANEALCSDASEAPPCVVDDYECVSDCELIDSASSELTRPEPVIVRAAARRAFTPPDPDHTPYLGSIEVDAVANGLLPARSFFHVRIESANVPDAGDEITIPLALRPKSSGPESALLPIEGEEFSSSDWGPEVCVEVEFESDAPDAALLEAESNEELEIELSDEAAVESSEELAAESSEQLEVELSEDAAVEPSAELAAEVNEDLAAESSEDLAVESEDLAVESSEELAAESSEELAVESSEELAAESSEELAAESSEELAAESSEELAAESSEELVAESSEELVAESSEELVAESSEELAAESSEELAAESSEELVAESSEELAAESSEDLAAESSEELGAESSEELAAESSEELAAESSEEIVAESSEELAAESSEEAQADSMLDLAVFGENDAAEDFTALVAMTAIDSDDDAEICVDLEEYLVPEQELEAAAAGLDVPVLEPITDAPQPELPSAPAAEPLSVPHAAAEAAAPIWIDRAFTEPMPEVAADIDAEWSEIAAEVALKYQTPEPPAAPAPPTPPKHPEQASLALAPAPARFLPRQSDVDDLLSKFRVEQARSDRELCRELKGIAGLDLTPGAPQSTSSTPPPVAAPVEPSDFSPRASGGRRIVPTITVTLVGICAALFVGRGGLPGVAETAHAARRYVSEIRRTAPNPVVPVLQRREPARLRAPKNAASTCRSTLTVEDAPAGAEVRLRSAELDSSLAPRRSVGPVAVFDDVPCGEALEVSVVLPSAEGRAWRRIPVAAARAGVTTGSRGVVRRVSAR